MPPPLAFPHVQAIAADPRNPLAKFERAAVLMAEDRCRDALAELHALKVLGFAGWGGAGGGRWHLGVEVVCPPLLPSQAQLCPPHQPPCMGALPALPLPAQDIAPREASVLFHMGKICKKLGMLDEAMACFDAALDLQPPSSDTNLIKSAIEKLRVPDDNEEEEI
jgi:anaphase-promoting complex subunit 3